MNFSELVIDKNHQYCVVTKPAGIPVQPDKTGDESLLDQAGRYFKQKLFLVHRIDRPVSGLVLLAKKKSSAAYFSELFKNGLVQKTYLAVVENELPETEGVFQSTISTGSGPNNKSRVNSSPSESSTQAITRYKVIGKTDRYTIVCLWPQTGKHHQLRAHLGDAGCPIKGDVKYGARRANKDRSIHLHAWKVSFEHPVTKEQIEYTAPLPQETLWQFVVTSLNEQPHE